MPDIPSPTVTVTSADEITAPIVAAMPPAPATPPPADSTPPPAATGTGTLDSLGRPFDGAKFAPRFDKAGRWVNRNAGRKKSVSADPEPAAETPATPPPAEKSFVPADLLDAPEQAQAAPAPAAETPAPAPASSASKERYRMLADVYCRGAISAAVGLVSDEWQPDNDAEYIALRDAIAAWMEAEQAEELSPKAAAALAIFAYAMRRMSRPKTLSRLASWKLALWSWWKGRQAARTAAAFPAV